MSDQKFGKFLVAAFIAGGGAVLTLDDPRPPEAVVTTQAPAPEETTTSTTAAPTTTTAPRPTTSATTAPRAKAASTPPPTQSCYRCTIFTTTTKRAPFTMSRLQRRIGGCESSGTADGPLIYNQTNKSGSSASGAYQWLDGTWVWMARDYGSDVGATKYRRAMYAPPHTQDVVMARALADGQAYHWRASQSCWG